MRIYILWDILLHHIIYNLILLQELRQGYQAEADATGNPRMSVSMAVPAGEYNIDLGYDVLALSR